MGACGIRFELSSCKYASIIKNKHNQLRSRQLNRMGHDFLRIRGGEIFNLWANGEKPNFYEKTHQAVNYLSCLSPQIIYFCQNVVELVIAWNGKSMGKEIRIGQRPIFENRVLTSLARKMPKNVCHSAMHPCFSVSSRFGSSWSFSCVFHSTFLVAGFIFPMDGRSF